ncbi:C4-dicarboxylate transporter DctA, partial [bacterium]|nr:C4-dicarboxylate transporter DctA [bacterium]
MIFRKLYFQVLLAIVCGVFLGWIAPEFAIQLKPVSEAFIFGIKILVAPLIFTTVCLGISRSGSGKDAVRVGLRALIYFELVSTFALMIGLGVGNWVQPGAAFPITVAALDPTLVQNYVVKRGSILNPWESGLNLVQVLVVALVSGVGLLWARTEFRMRANSALEAIGNRGFRWMSLYMRMAPLGAAAAMAFTVGKFGFGALAPLASLMACFYLTCAGFVLLVLGTILVMIRVPVFRFFSYLKDEIILVLGTSSSESALAPLMGKLSRMGCDSKVVGLVVPTGYSFNLDGTNIYLTLAILFIAQAFGVQLGLPEQLEI